MKNDRILRWCARSYAHLLWVLRGRDRGERQAIREDGERLLLSARGQGHLRLAATWVALVWDLLFVGARHDVTQALRSLVRAPAWTIGIATLLGLGVAATTTLFAFVDAVLLRPLPYDEPERLVVIWEANASQDRVREGPSPGNVLDWVGRNDTFEAITALMRASAMLRGREGGTPVTGAQVTHGFFDVYRRRPSLGRTFQADEYDGAISITSGLPDRGEPVVVLSHQLWQALGADPQLVGDTVDLEGRKRRVVGVMPADFVVPDAETKFWVPWDMRESYRGTRFPDGPPRDFRFLQVAGRMKVGMSIQGAEARMRTLASELEAEHPATNAGWSVRLFALADEISRTSRLELLIVFSAMLCLLLLLCANVANLAIARGVSRTREIAIRLALGASGSRVRRQLIAESALSAIVTIGFALLLTAWSVDAAVALAPSDIPRLHDVTMNVRVGAFAVLLGVVVIGVGSAVPSLRASRPPVAGALKDGADVSASRSGRLRARLVVAEIAGAVMLLVGAGLLARTYAELRRVDVGFDTHNLLVLRVTPDASRYRTNPERIDYYRQVLDSLRAVPTIASVAAVTALPMGTIGADFERPYWPEHAHPGSRLASEARVRMATPEYFGTLGRSVTAGREFTDRDAADAPRVVIVNEKLATAAWGHESPLGRRLILDYQKGPYPYEVVGVVRDARHKGPRNETTAEIFIPHAQNPYLVMNLIARTTIDPLAVAQTARAAARRVAPDQPVHSVTTMDRLLGDAVQQDRFSMLLITLFAIAGLVTAAGGVYALLAFTVAQRRREIALRMALGASPRRVATSIVMESLLLASAGGAIGILGAAVGGRFVRTLLFGVAPEDPMTLVTAVTVLMVVVIAASWLPARRAARINPAPVMRT